VGHNEMRSGGWILLVVHVTDKLLLVFLSVTLIRCRSLTLPLIYVLILVFVCKCGGLTPS